MGIGDKAGSMVVTKIRTIATRKRAESDPVIKPCRSHPEADDWASKLCECEKKRYCCNRLADGYIGVSQSCRIADRQRSPEIAGRCIGPDLTE